MEALPKAIDNPDKTAREAGEAVGVPVRSWFIAIVNNNTERQCARKLEKLGFESYVPTQQETRLWRNGMRNMVCRIILPSLLFIRATETERLGKIVGLPFIKRFMTDRASTTDSFGRHKVAVVPDGQIEMLRFMLGNAESAVTIEKPPLRLGDKVRVFRGKLAGFEGYVDRMEEGKAKIYILVNCLGCASVEVERISLELIK